MTLFGMKTKISIDGFLPQIFNGCLIHVRHMLDTLWTLFERQYLWKEAVNKILIFSPNNVILWIQIQHQKISLLSLLLYPNEFKTISLLNQIALLLYTQLYVWTLRTYVHYICYSTHNYTYVHYCTYVYYICYSTQLCHCLIWLNCTREREIVQSIISLLKMGRIGEV